ncbi:MAG: leucine-rich repeat domain-containing protein [Bacteroidota bacterium]
MIQPSFKRVRYVLCVSLLGSLQMISSAVAQSIPDTTAISAYKEEAKYMLSFVEFVFNTVGDPFSSAQQKETIIQESYLKAFRDHEVQVEDDLVENRSTVINKDIQAYLKDIDFFFKEARFTFLIEEITHEVNETGELYFKIQFARNLQGITNDNDSVNSSQERFVEINLDPERRELKIASMYTTKLSEQEDLKNWWNTMPYGWKKIFASEVYINDTLGMGTLLEQNELLLVGDTLFYSQSSTPASEAKSASASLDDLFAPYEDTFVVSSPDLFEHLKQIQSRTSLDLTGQDQLDNLEPLSKMTQLKELNLSGTNVYDLVPLRNLTRLESLDISYSQIDDLSPLKFAIGLKDLNISNSPLLDLTPLTFFPQLKSLNCSYTDISDLQVISSLSQLRELNFQNTQVESIAPLAPLEMLEQLRFANTKVKDLSALKNKPRLEFLYIDNNQVSDLAPLSTNSKLRLIHCNKTSIENLHPLSLLTDLKKVYCDNTKIGRVEAAEFMKNKPGCLVIFESSALTDWWKNLPGDWETYFLEVMPTAKVGTEYLHELAKITSVDIREKKNINSLEPLQMLTNLKVLNCRGAGIDKLEGIEELVELKTLNCSYTGVHSLEPARFLKSLTQIDASNTSISSLEPLQGLSRLRRVILDKTEVEEIMPLVSVSGLKTIFCDETHVKTEEVQRFLMKSPDCLLVFQTAELEVWWKRLGKTWQGIFQNHVKSKMAPNRKQLHQMISLKAISIEDNSDILTLTPLTQCLRLTHLKIQNTRISDLTPLSDLPSLQSLTTSRNPVSDLGPLRVLDKLTYLNIENTPIEDISPLADLKNLEELNFGGTQVGDIRPLETLTSIKQLDCSNTPVKKLKSLNNLPNLIVLKCFNTRVPAKKVQAFDHAHPQCEVIYY